MAYKVKYRISYLNGQTFISPYPTPEFNQFIEYTLIDNTSTDPISTHLPVFHVINDNSDNNREYTFTLKDGSKTNDITTPISNVFKVEIAYIEGHYEQISFQNLNYIKSIDQLQVTKNWTSLYRNFSGCSRMESINTSNWDTSNVTSIGEIFCYCSSLTSLDVSNWDTSSIVDMSIAFCFASIPSLDASNWDTSNVKYMNNMFQSCNLLTSLVVSNWDTSNVTNSNSMFTGIPEISVLGWNYDGTNYTNFTLTEEQTGYAYTFPWNMYVVEYAIDNSSTTDTLMKLPAGFEDGIGTFGEALDIQYYEYLPRIYLAEDNIIYPNSNTTLITLNNGNKTNDMTTLVKDIENIKILYPKNAIKVSFGGYYVATNYYTTNNITSLININTSNFTTLDEMFRNCEKLINVNCANWNLNNVTSIKNLFSRCISLETIDVSKWDIVGITCISSAFNKCESLKTIDVSKWDTSTVTAMNNAFNNCINLTSLDVANWNTSNVTDMSAMFSNCPSLVNLDVSNWKMDNVTSIISFFSGCKLLSSVDLTKWNTSNVEKMNFVFANCESLTSLDLSNWSIDKVQSTFKMFNNCTALKSLDLSTWDTSKLTNSNDMFTNVPEITEWHWDGVNYANWTLTEEQCGYSYEFPWNSKFYVEYTIDYASDTSVIGEQVLANNPETDDSISWGYVYLPYSYHQDIAPFSLERRVELGLDQVMPDDVLFDKGIDLSSPQSISKYIENYTESSLVTTPAADGVQNDSNYSISVRDLEPHEKVRIYLKDGSITNDVVNTLAKDVEKIRYYYPKNYNVKFKSVGFGYENDPYNHNVTSILYFNTSNFTSFSYLFNFCEKLTSLDVTNWCTSKVKDLRRTFYANLNLKEIKGLDTWDVSNVTDMGATFSYCWSLPSLDLSSWGPNIGNVSNFASTFSGMNGLKNLNLSNWQIGDEARLTLTFSMLVGNTVIDFTNWGNGTIKSLLGTFMQSSGLKNLDLSNWNVSQNSNFSQVFTHCSGLENLNISTWDVSNGSSFYSFLAINNSATSKLKSIPGIEQWNITNKAYNLFQVFNGQDQLTELDLSGWDVSNVSDMSQMFRHCNNLKKLNISTWDVSNVTNMSSTFQNCYSLEEFDMYNVTKTIPSSGVNITNMLNNAAQNAMIFISDNDNIIKTTYPDKYYIYRNKYVLDTTMQYPVTYGSNWEYVYNQDNSVVIFDYQDLEATKSSYLIDWGDGTLDYELSHTYDSAGTYTIYTMNNSLSKYRKNNNIYQNSSFSYRVLSAKISNYPYESFRSFFECMENIANIDLSLIDTSKSNNFVSMFCSCLSLGSIDITNFIFNNSNTKLDGLFSSCENAEILLPEPFISSNISSIRELFSNCNGLTTLDVSNWNTSNITNLNNVFSHCKNLTEIIGINNLDTQNVTELWSTFFGCTSLTSLDLSNWNVNKVEKTNLMFSFCTSLTSLNLSGWNTSSVNSSPEMFNNVPEISVLGWHYDGTNYANWTLTEEQTTYAGVFPWNIENLAVYTFNNTKAVLPSITGIEASDYVIYDHDNGNGTTTRTLEFTTKNRPTAISFANESSLISVEELNISGLTTFANLFNECRSLTSVNTAGWDTSEITDMSYMFSNNRKLASIDVSHFNTSNVTNMKYMFYYNSLLTTVDVSNWEIGNVTDMSYMFAFDKKLKTLDVSNWDTGNVTNMNYMLYYASSLEALDVSQWNVENVTNMGGLFANSEKITSLDVSNWNTSKVENMEYLFHCMTNLASIDLTKWDTSNVTDMKYMLAHLKKITSLDMSVFDMHNVTNIQGMFAGCSAMKSIEVSNWDTGNVRDMQGLFYSCNALEDVDVSNWDVRNVEKINEAFRYLDVIKTLDISNWKTEKVQNGFCFVSSCPNLESLDLSKWTCPELKNAGQMFSYLDKITYLDLSGFTMSKVLRADRMFIDNKSLTEIKGLENFDTSNITNMDSMFSGCESLTTLNLSTWNTSSVTNYSNMFNGIPELSVLGWNYDGSNYANWTLTEEQTGYAYNFPWNMYVAEYTIVDRTVTVEDTVSEPSLSRIPNNIQYYIDEDEKGVVFIKENENYNPDLVAPAAVVSAGDVINTEGRYLPIIYTSETESFRANSKNTVLTLSNNSKSNDVDNVLAADVTNIKVYYPKDTYSIRFTVTDNVDNKNYDFFYIQELLDLTITSNIKSVRCMFNHCYYLTSINGLEKTWDLSNVIDTCYMFYYCYALSTQIDVSNWSMGKVECAQCMFGSCRLLTTLDVSNWDVSKVVNMNAMFMDTGVTTLNVSNWDTSSAESMASMFFYSKIKTLDVSNWKVDKVIYMQQMFQGAPVTTVDMSKWTPKALTYIALMFCEVSNLSTLDFSNFGECELEEMFNAFSMSLNLSNIIGLDKLNTSKVKDMYGIFAINNSNVSKLTDSSLRGIEKWDTSSATTLQQFMNGQDQVTELDLSGWDVSNVTNMVQAFRHGNKLKKLNVSTWDVSNVTDMSSVFQNCYSLEEFDMYNFSKTMKTSGVNTSNMLTNTAQNAMVFVSSENNKIQTLFPSLNYIYRNEITIDLSKPWYKISEDGESASSVITNDVTFKNTIGDVKNDTNATYLVDWGDGTLDYSLSHEYAQTGTYKIYTMNFPSHYGKYGMITSFSSCDRTIGCKVSNYPYTSFHSAFTYCRNLALEYLDLSICNTSKCTDFTNTFAAMTFTTIDLSNLDLSSAENLSGMFSSCTNLTTLDLSSWDTSHVTNLKAIFSQCSNLKNLNLTGWDTGNVIEMGNMFEGCSKLTSTVLQPFLSNFITSNVEKMYYLFKDCTGLTSLDLSMWNTSKLNLAGSMFHNCSNLVSLNTEGWNTSNLSSTFYMFCNCKKLTNLDLSHWYLPKLKYCQNMFQDCTGLKNLDFSGWTSENASNIVNGVHYKTGKFTDMFKNCSSLESINLSNLNTDLDDATITDMFLGVPENVDWNWDGVNYANWKYTEAQCNYAYTFPWNSQYYVEYTIDNSSTTDTLMYIHPDLSDKVDNYGSNLDVYYYTYLPRFYDSNNEVIYADNSSLIKLITLNDNSKTNSLDTQVSNVKNIRIYYPKTTTSIAFEGYNCWQTFIYPHNIKELNYIKVDNFTSFKSMFNVCRKLINVNTANWDTSKVTDMSGVFKECMELEYVDVSNWNMANVVNMANMFNKCNKLQSVDVSNWDTHSATAMNHIFYYCDKLKTIDVTNWNTSKATTLNNIFNNCTSLVSVDVSKWDVRNVETLMSIFYGCTSLETIIGLENWVTDSLTDLNFAFCICNKLTSLNINNWKVDKVTRMQCTFLECSSLTSLDLSNWRISSLTNIQQIFKNCSSLTSLNISNWDTSNITDSNGTFTGIPEISVLGWNYDGTNYTNFTLTEEQTGYAYTFPWNKTKIAEYTIPEGSND